MSNSQVQSTRILFCVLNWGLGHATRSIPIIQALISRGHDVSIATDGRAKALLKAEFPNLVFHELPPYGVRYEFRSMFLNLLYQWPKVLGAVIREYFEVKRLTKANRYDVIISDNRYGCFHKNCRSVCITHQINPITSYRLTDLLGKLVSRILLSNFEEVWIPDDLKMGCLAGPMVIPSPKHSKYIGFISRFNPVLGQNEKHDQIDIAIILSGPEPLRSQFERKVMQQLDQFTGSWALVRGKTEGENTWYEHSSSGKTIDYLTSHDLQVLINSASLVVSRSGYTSLMDYLILGCRALIIPTPGQYEQEYLAHHIPHGMPFIGSSEEEMNILSTFDRLNYIPSAEPYNSDILKSTLDDLFS